jgi:hypothetical protein
VRATALPAWPHGTAPGPGSLNVHRPPPHDPGCSDYNAAQYVRGFAIAGFLRGMVNGAATDISVETALTSPKRARFKRTTKGAPSVPPRDTQGGHGGAEFETATRHRDRRRARGGWRVGSRLEARDPTSILRSLHGRCAIRHAAGRLGERARRPCHMRLSPTRVTQHRAHRSALSEEGEGRHRVRCWQSASAYPSISSAAVPRRAMAIWAHKGALPSASLGVDRDCIRTISCQSLTPAVSVGQRSPWTQL